MSSTAIQIEGLGKRYQLGAARQPYFSLRDSMASAAAAPLRLIQRLTDRGLVTAGSERKEDFWALRDVSFEVKHGEVLGIIGRNGAGKSTLLKLLSEITEPTTGRISLDGRVASLLEVGTGFHPELTGRENIFLNGAILGMGRAEIARKFDEIVAFAEVEKFVDTQVKRYSSGMYLRLAFAVAAHLEPDILLLDEVLAVGDAAFQQKCLGKMADVSREGRTVLFVSHNMSAIVNLCSRCILLRQAQLLADGSPQKTVTSYIASTATNDDQFNLDRIVVRSGRGRVRFLELMVEDADGNRGVDILSGMWCAFRLRYAAETTATLRNCRVSIAARDVLGQHLFVCSTELTELEEWNLPPRGIVDCIIPRFPLSGGTYQLSIFFEVNREIEDWIDGGVSIAVVDGPFFPGGRQYPNGFGGKGVLVDHCWRVNGASF